ncbi:MAG: sensor histidine kinase [Vicinamibacterales bacterium]
MASVESKSLRDPVGYQEVPASWVFALALLVAVILGTAIASQTYLSMLGHGHSFRSILSWQVSSWALWALVAPVVVGKAGAMAAGHRSLWRTLLHLLPLGIVSVAVHIGLATQLAIWIQPHVPVVATDFGTAFLALLQSMLAVDVLAYTMLVLVGWAVAVSGMARALETRESRLEAELTRAQLEALRLEIQPHFLFNTLNTVAALIRSRANDRALDMLLGLSDLMRQTLHRPVDHIVTLDAELEFTRRYVDLQQARFGSRLGIAYRIADDAHGLGVPPFVLQPLVENALRHGFGRMAERCEIEIGAALDAEGLRLWVRDDGAGLPPDFTLHRSAGTGLRNTMSRIERLFGRAARLTVVPQPGGGTLASVLLPAQPVAQRETIA